MGRLLAIALAVAAAGIAVVAVNGPGIDKPEEKDDLAPKAQSGKTSQINPDGSVSGAAAADAPVGATVLMDKLAFGPASATLRAGQSVRFVNKDSVTHTVIQDFGPRSGLIPQVDSERIPPGEDFTFIARTAGEINYICTLHPTVMTGRLVVTGAAA